MQETVDDFSAFLRDHPAEFLVLGLNGLTGFVCRQCFVEAVVNALGGKDAMISASDLHNASLGTLKNAGKRVAIFAPIGTCESIGCILSSSYLNEGWGGAMENGDLDQAEKWMVGWLAGQADSRYLVMQANPNDADANSVTPNMYTRINAQRYARAHDGALPTGWTGVTSDLVKPTSLEQWEQPFLMHIETMIQQATKSNLALRVNAISTDFLTTSKPLEIALRLNGISKD